MKQIVKFVAIILLMLLLTGTIIAAIMAISTTKRFIKTYKPSTPYIDIPTDPLSLKRGAMLSASNCTYCHGSDFSGMKIFENPQIGTIYSHNLTPGGSTKNYKNKDWVNAIRFGVKPNGTAIFVMPCTNFNMISDHDLGCIIAYMKTIPASDRKIPDQQITPYGKIYIANGSLGKLFSAEEINMADNTSRSSPKIQADSAYGNYIITIYSCKYCHGTNLNGYKDADPAAPPAPNITKGGNLGKWSSEQFLKTIRFGITPAGKRMDPDFMPWPNLSTLNNTELLAIYEYLKSQPALTDANY